jgi:adenine/guanine phosphoribosyltransferase-like PRPP-binding protein
VLPRLHGAFSTVLMTKDRVVAFRDPAGLRPLVIGRVAPLAGEDGRRATASPASRARSTSSAPSSSATCARRGRLARRGRAGVDPGVEGEREAFCVFEYIYFARPDSRMGGSALQVVRGRMGEILAREAPVDADLVIPVPDSGNPAARGYARASGLPQDDGFVKNRYVQRTFIQPGQELRKHGLRLKFNPLPEVVAGKRLVVVDDSIVRGNTTRQIVRMLRDAGAAEIHLRITAPPIKHPCHYGIDMSTREEMIAHGAASRRSPPSWAATRSPTSRSRASTRRSAARAIATATPASPASTRSRAARVRSARTRSSCPFSRSERRARAGRFLKHSGDAGRSEATQKSRGPPHVYANMGTFLPCIWAGSYTPIWVKNSVTALVRSPGR